MAYATISMTGRLRLAILACGLAAVVPHAGAAGEPATPVTELVQRFTAAQQQMDAATLRELTAENYIETSPLGEIDPRDKMLSFYVKKEGAPALPATTVEDTVTRVFGDTAIVIAKVSYTRSAGGQSRVFSLRSTFVAHKHGGRWKMVSAHYTPIHPPKNPG